MKTSSWCSDCRSSKIHHIDTWLEAIISVVMPKRAFPYWVESTMYLCLEKILVLSHLGRYTTTYTKENLSPKMVYFFEALTSQNVTPYVLNVADGYPMWKVQIGDTIIRETQIPTPHNELKNNELWFNDKYEVKKFFAKHGFPQAEGKMFLCFNKHKIRSYVATLGFPVVVKPRTGTFSRHVTTNIKTMHELDVALSKVLEYSPWCIIEKYFEDISVYRMTVTDDMSVFCLQQVPAFVTGDGHSTIEELVAEKNKEILHGFIRTQHPVLHALQIDHSLVFDTKHIPQENAVVYLQKDPFLRTGGDTFEVTTLIHPDTIALAKDIAKKSKLTLVGIDFMINDISTSWKETPCGLLEINTMPSIEMHRYPSYGIPTDPAKNIVASLIARYS